MIPHVAPPVWPERRLGSFAGSIYCNHTDLFNTPDAADAVLGKCGVAIIGLADDTGVVLNHGRPGAARGPQAFRNALARYGVAIPPPTPPLSPLSHSSSNSRRSGQGEREGVPHVVGNHQHAGHHVFDVGDVVLGQTLAETHDRVTEAVRAVVGFGLFPIAIGGGHDLTFPFVRGVHREQQLTAGVYIDPHLDVRETEGSGMPFRALIEREGLRRLHCYGFNPLVNTADHWRWFVEHGCRTTARSDVDDPNNSGANKANPFDEFEPDDRLFCSFDLDAIDASQAPGVSALNPDGLSVREATKIVERAGADPRVRCFDLMELCPPHDPDGRTARIAAHLFLTFLRGLSSR